MQQSLRSIPACVREQFSILVENIKTLTRVRQEVGSGPVGQQVDREFRQHLEALGELRERVFEGSVLGSNVSPLEAQPDRVEVLDLSFLPPRSSTQPQLSH